MAEQPARTLRILVVEDDTETLLATMELLELLGHRATGVRSAEAASDRFLEGFFDLLFVDLNLPGLSGMDLVKKLRSRERLPVIVASGAGPRFQELEHVIWLHKPYTTEQLQDALSQCCSGRASGTSSRPPDP
jgi:CheY-like chemotaxis protein